MFCSHCGAELQPAQESCPSCGNPVGGVRIQPTKGRLANNLRLLGILWIALSALRLLGAGALLVVANFLFADREFLWAICSLVGGFLLILAVGGMAAGWGLWERLSWARPLALGVAAVSLLDIPFGTALGIYTLLVLLPAEAEEEYNRTARAA
jgi:hypothetical protein